MKMPTLHGSPFMTLLQCFQVQLPQLDTEIKPHNRPSRCVWGTVFLILLCQAALGQSAHNRNRNPDRVQSNQAELEAISTQAQEAMSAKDWAGASKLLQRLAELAPDTPEVFANLGVAYYSQSRVLDAANAFERALRLNPRMTRAQTMLGLCYAELGRHREAIPILRSAFLHPPDDQLGKLIGLDLQRAYSGLQQNDKAMGVADELLKRYPSDPEILFQSSRLHADRAYELMSQLMQRAPDSVWSYYATAEVHESLQHYDLAIAEYKKILEIDPRMPGIHFRLGRAILRSSKEADAVDGALKEFEQELAVTPENADADYEIGEIYRQRGKFGSAIEHFSRAVQHHSDFSQARMGLASVLMIQGRPREALAQLLEAVRSEPENEVAHFRLAAAYRALGDTAAQQREMALFQKLHSAGSPRAPQLSGASVAADVTQQTIDPENRTP